MKKDCTNQLLLKELVPWLEQFTMLGKRGLAALELIKLYDNGDFAAFWEKYVSNKMSTDEQKAYEAHKCGTMKLQPFYENTMDRLADKFFHTLTSQQPTTLKGVGSFPTLRTTQSKLMFDGDTATYYHSGKAQSREGGEWFGADLGSVKDVWEINIQQGRNSIDDVDYFDHACLEYSADGKAWNTLIANMQKRYDIHWQGESVKARYVRVRKLPSEKTNWVAVRIFEVNPPKQAALNFSIIADDAKAALKAFDNHPGTSYTNTGALSFTIPAGTKAYTILAKLNPEAPVVISQLDVKGNVIEKQEVASPFIKIAVANGARTIKVDGKIELYEVIPAK